MLILKKLKKIMAEYMIKYLSNKICCSRQKVFLALYLKLLSVLILVFTFSFSAHSIKAKDLKLSSSNFTPNSIFNADSQSDVTGILGSLQCAIGVTGKGEPIYCDMVG